MKTLKYIIFFVAVLFSCTNSRQADSFESFEQKKLADFEKYFESIEISFDYFVSDFKSIKLPMEINDSILWKSTLVEMRGLCKIDTLFVNLFMNYEYESRDTVKFHNLIYFYRVGKIDIDSAIVGLIYLKSYRSQYVQGGKKDIYKIVTFDMDGNLISQKDLAGFITDYSKKDDRLFWNTCKIDKNLKITLEMKEEVADYDLDTSYLISKTRKNYFIDKKGIIN